MSDTIHALESLKIKSRSTDLLHKVPTERSTCPKLEGSQRKLAEILSKKLSLNSKIDNVAKPPKIGAGRKQKNKTK